MGKIKMNEDKMLQAVLSDKELIAEYNYIPADYSSVTSAYVSPNPVIEAIGTIIREIKNGEDQKTVYKKILKQFNDNLV